MLNVQEEEVILSYFSVTIRLPDYKLWHPLKGRTLYGELLVLTLEALLAFLVAVT